MKRSRLERKTPLKRETRLRTVSERRRQRDADYPQRRQQVWDRQDGHCGWSRDFHTGDTFGIEHCTREMTDVHHIAGRGGSQPHRLSNLVGLCAEHHRWVHANPEKARDLGLMRSRLGGDA